MRSVSLRASSALLVALVTGCAAPATSAESVATESQSIIAGTPSGSAQDSVVFLFHDAAGHQTCSATMLAPNLLVTARHCVSASSGGVVTDWVPADLHVYVGADAALRTHRVAVGKEIVVPSSQTSYPDVAFLVLDTHLTTPLAAVRLDGGISLGEKLDVVGYGIDETGTRPAARMQRTGVTVLGIGPGRSRIGEPLAKGEFFFGEAACSGDSGGPAFSSTTGALVGIASRVGNGSAPDAAAPSAFCMGAQTDDVYTDFAPLSELTAHAFEAAGAEPIAESSGSPSDRGQLASAPLIADPTASGETATTQRVEAGGCAATPRAGDVSSALAPLLGLLALVRRRIVSRIRSTRGSTTSHM